MKIAYRELPSTGEICCMLLYRIEFIVLHLQNVDKNETLIQLR